MTECTDTEHRCIALALAFFHQMQAVPQTDELTRAAIARCNAERPRNTNSRRWVGEQGE